MSGDRIEIGIPRSANFLGLVRRFFGDLAGHFPGLPLDEKEVAEIQLVLQEACINAIRHARVPPRPASQVRVVFLLEKDRLTIEIHDQGHGFDPDSVPEPEASRLQEGGYGVYIMKQSMDRVEARQAPDGFVLSLTKFYRESRQSVEAGLE